MERTYLTLPSGLGRILNIRFGILRTVRYLTLVVIDLATHSPLGFFASFGLLWLTLPLGLLFTFLCGLEK